MRLIDADAIIYDEIEEGFFAVTMWRIDGAPTIEAIPVSWFKRQISLLRKEGFDEDALYLEKLLELWEERGMQ